MIPFNEAPMNGMELGYIKDALQNTNLCGNGAFTRRCQQWIESLTGGGKVFLTTSCTSSLEIAAIYIVLE